MKSKNIWLLFCVIGLYLLTPRQGYAQSAANKPNQEQIVEVNAPRMGP